MGSRGATLTPATALMAGAAAAVLLVAGGPQAPAVGERAASALAEIPLLFVPNRGQADERVRYQAHGPGYAIAFADDEVVLSLVKDGGRRGVGLALRFVGADAQARPEGRERLPATVSYLRGNDPARWQAALPAYSGVAYRDLWPGIDLVLRGEGGALKYEFRVRPGARPADIRLAYAGADGLAVGRDGALLVRTPLGALRDAPPVAYQQVGGRRVPVEARYVVGGREYGFALGAYRPDRELVIDPSLQYSTFIGGSSHERADGIAVGGDGSVYLVGTTQSSDLPASPGAFDTTFAGGVVDVFAAKLAPDGSLAYMTYLGGTPTPLVRGTGEPIEFGRGIAVDGQGRAYLTGQTSSSDFPTTAGAFDTTINASDRNANDGFVTVLDPSGSSLVWSTFLGGTSNDDPDAIALDAAGNVYVTGLTVSTDFPVTAGAAQTANGGGQDAFVTKLGADGSSLVYSTYLGGADNEIGTGVAVDLDGAAYVSGGTRSADFPSTPGAFDPTHNGGAFEELFDAFVAKLDAAGSSLVYSTFLGGSRIDRADDVAVDSAGNAYVSGSSSSPEFPTTSGSFDPGGGGSFVTKLNAAGSGLVYSTFLAGGGAAGLALDADGGVWVTGGAGAAAPTTTDAFDTTHNGETDAWVGKLDATGSALAHATFLGGSQSESGVDVALDAAGAVYVAGTTYSADFPTTAGAFDRTFAGDPAIFWGDAFVAKLGSGEPGDTTPPPVERTTTTFSGKIDKSQTRAHTVSMGAGPVDVRLDWNDARVNLALRVRDPGGTIVFSASGSAKPKSGTFSAAAAGDYRFEVVNTVDRNTDYTLAVTHPVVSASPPPPPSPALDSLALDPTAVTGGGSSTGTVTLTSAAPSGGVVIGLASSDTSAATVPVSVTIPGGAASATFTVSTATVSADTSVTISASFDGVTRTAALAVAAPATSASLASVGLDPTTVTGGDSSTGTVTLTAAAPTGGAAVSLASSNTAVATVPASVTVPAGATSAGFTVSTASVTVDSSSAISASYAGVTRSAILSVRAPAAADTVSISRAEYDGDKRVLRVEASSSGSSATLTVHVTSTGETIGTLSGGQGEFSWPTNPESITVRSSLGGSATRTVELK